ncbi:hypothetical protein ARMSODRAFT_1026036 [Armillaria solidipes]|uniref:Uncharacterized protein n=1 Tax=Armillaria solidipes TaxID=1076256 RepID=A0A2H3B8L5_9AGAR|nr:hypothetical protein ARMSODRAFT_1026036 [Armillaria solidipes]
MQQEDPSLTSDDIWGPDDGDMSEAKRRDENVFGMKLKYEEADRSERRGNLEKHHQKKDEGDDLGGEANRQRHGIAVSLGKSDIQEEYTSPRCGGENGKHGIFFEEDMAVFELNVTMAVTLRTPTTLSAVSPPSLRQGGTRPFYLSVCKMLSQDHLYP